MAELGGMLASAILKVVSDQIGSAIGGRIKLQMSFTEDLQKMKMTLESVEALLDDAERRSITDKSTRLWLKRLKVAMYATSDMIDEFEDDAQSITQPSKHKFLMKNYVEVIIPCLKIGHKITLASKLKTMRVDLDEITSQHKKFNLLARTNATEMKVPDERETSSKMFEQIFGRSAERDTILAYLSKRAKKMTILPIYGIGGLGKTTLAQMIYASSKFKDYSHVWVYVSQAFDMKKIGNSIISQLSEKESQYTEMQMIENSLSKLLADKKILIVLDDLWEEKKIDLDKLKGMLNVGNGSTVVVIVTTRNESIAMEVSTIQPHKLAILSNDLCWSIIKHKSAFESRDDKNELKQIGKEIASKCGGVALAAQSLGYVLQSMTSRQWKIMRDSDIWSTSDSKDMSLTHVLASLRLSYSVMPAYLKLCFAYCAIFPKGQKIVKDELVQQWFALAFIESTDVYSSWELGEIYIRQLLGLSFLQNSESPSAAGGHLEDATLFTMHDLVHDLARSVMVDEIVVHDKQSNTAGSCGRYALLDDCSKPFESSKIRALRFMNCCEIELDGAAFSSAKSLRILDLSECSILKLPDSIGIMKQLRYLNAPRIQHGTIPCSITRLSKLIYLSLHGSSSILELPESIGEIQGLIYLNLSGCSGIEKLPESFGELKNLVHLDLSNCSSVEGISLFLGSLKKLLHLNLSYCLNIGELPEALGALSELQYLNLSYSSYLRHCNEAEVLGNLNKLQYLNLSSESCFLEKLPEAVGSFNKLKYLNLSGCSFMEELPRLFGNLRNLVHLDLSECCQVNGVPQALHGLTNLQYLNLSVTCVPYNQCLSGLPEVIGNLAELRFLNLSKSICRIFGFYGDMFDDAIASFICSITNLFNLEHLDLSNNGDIRYIPGSLCNLTKLHTLNLSNCARLEEIPERIGTIDSLKTLYLNGSYIRGELPQLSRNSISLPRFVVHAGDGECSSNLVLLQHTDPAELEIDGLENVKSTEEAHSIRLMEKEILTDLRLQWSTDTERYVNDKMVLEELVPPSTLKELRIQGYNSVRFPAWLMDITHYLHYLVKVGMYGLPMCKSLPPMDKLPYLESLVLNDMSSLEEWNTSYSCGEEHVMSRLQIYDCPKLRIKPLPPRAQLLHISNSDSVLSSWGEYTAGAASTTSSYPANTTLHVENTELPMHQWRLLQHLPGLTHIEITDCSDLTVSPEILQHLSSLKSVKLNDRGHSRKKNVRDQEELPQWLGELTSLQKLQISWASGLKELPESMRLLTKLKSLKLDYCSSITSLPHWLGELTSLEKLKIDMCDGISSLPDGIQQLTNLQKLEILDSIELSKWCELEENEAKLAHIEDKQIRTGPPTRLYCGLFMGLQIHDQIHYNLL